MKHSIIVLLTAAALAAVACGGGSGGEATPTGAPSATSGPTPASSPSGTQPAEGGRDPIYWRTSDDFHSVRTNEPYKVVLRVTNGYTEDTLPIEAKSVAGAATISFEAQRVDAPGEEKGSFYAVSLDFPRQGRYEVTFTAGADQVSTEINVMAGAGPSG